MIKIPSIVLLTVVVSHAFDDMDLSLVPQSCLDQKNEIKQCAEKASADQGIGFTCKDIQNCFALDNSTLDENQIMQQFTGNSDWEDKYKCMQEQLMEPMRSCISGKIAFQLGNASELMEEKENMKKIMTYMFKAITTQMMVNHQVEPRPERPPLNKEELTRPIKYDPNENAPVYLMPDLMSSEETEDIDEELAMMDKPEPDTFAAMSATDKLSGIRNRFNQADAKTAINLAKENLSGAAATRLQDLKARITRRKRMIPQFDQIVSILNYLPDDPVKSCLQGFFGQVTNDQFKNALCASRNCVPADFKSTQCYQDTTSMIAATCECSNQLIESGQMKAAVDACQIDEAEFTQSKDCSDVTNQVNEGVGHMQQGVEQILKEFECST